MKKNIVDFMALLDVLILPSVAFEDFPNVILEGMALGKPVISTRLAGIPEQIDDGENGIIVQPGSVIELENAIVGLCSNSDLRTSMGHKSERKFEEKFTAEIARKNYLDLYNKLGEAKKT